MKLNKNWRVLLMEERIRVGDRRILADDTLGPPQKKGLHGMVGVKVCQTDWFGVARWIGKERKK